MKPTAIANIIVDVLMTLALLFFGRLSPLGGGSP